MPDPLFIYAGPSWAASSYPVDANSTNLSLEWNLPCINVSRPASSTFDQLDAIRRQSQSAHRPVIWIYNDPLTVLESVTSKSLRDFVQDPFWFEIYREVNQICLDRINDIGMPVLLIGGHCDVFDCDHENITIAHPSWQKWMAETSGMRVLDGVIDVEPTDGGNYQLDLCWGAEVVQRFLHLNQGVKAHASLVDSMWDIYFFWDELQRRDWFFEVHPNKRANIEFAKFLRSTVNLFLEKPNG